MRTSGSGSHRNRCPGCTKLFDHEALDNKSDAVQPYHEGTQGGDFPKRMLCSECYITDCQKAANNRLKDRPDNGNDESHYSYGRYTYTPRHSGKNRPDRR